VLLPGARWYSASPWYETKIQAGLAPLAPAQNLGDQRAQDRGRGAGGKGSRQNAVGTANTSPGTRFRRRHLVGHPASTSSGRTRTARRLHSLEVSPTPQTAPAAAGAINALGGSDLGLPRWAFIPATVRRPRLLVRRAGNYHELPDVTLPRRSANCSAAMLPSAERAGYFAVTTFFEKPSVLSVLCSKFSVLRGPFSVLERSWSVLKHALSVL
jgi:hypothetical protein